MLEDVSQASSLWLWQQLVGIKMGQGAINGAREDGETKEARLEQERWGMESRKRHLTLPQRGGRVRKRER